MSAMDARRRVPTVVGVLAAVVIGLCHAAPADAAPIGKVDPGVAFSSVVYGTGCLYSLTVTVNSAGLVTFWEQPPGYPARAIGSAWADGGIATVRWVPRRIGNRVLYATQNGVTGPTAVVPVRQGYGSGPLCFAV